MDNELNKFLDDVSSEPRFLRLVSDKKTKVCSVFEPSFFTEGGVWVENDAHFRKRISSESKNKNKTKTKEVFNENTI